MIDDSIRWQKRLHLSLSFAVQLWTLFSSNRSLGLLSIYIPLPGSTREFFLEAYPCISAIYSPFTPPFHCGLFVVEGWNAWITLRERQGPRFKRKITANGI